MPVRHVRIHMGTRAGRACIDELCRYYIYGFEIYLQAGNVACPYRFLIPNSKCVSKDLKARK
jgi:hypothetical protein